MSKHEQLESIDSAILDLVTGGTTTDGLGIQVPTPWGPAGVQLPGNSDYGRCLAANQSRAQAAFPDTRNWFERQLNLGTDTNGPARANYELQTQMQSCPLPQSS
jgi:hypothetical protein